MSQQGSGAEMGFRERAQVETDNTNINLWWIWL